MTQIHTARSVATAALQAHAENRLVAQHPEDSHLSYMNTQGHPCALGAALSKEEIDLVKSQSYVMARTLIDREILKVAPADATAVIHLQSLHDAWYALARTARCTDSLKNVAERDAAEAVFLAHIHDILAPVPVPAS